MSTDASQYKDTLTLPQTTFPMRGDLVTKEPNRLEQWEKEGLYERIQARRKAQSAPKFILHDGPPFANGDAHMGTALNKVMKDIVLKSKTMAGYETPYIPGWDCHGLPIEFKVCQNARDLEPAEIRRRCVDFASKWIDIQRASFRRLGVFGDWETPYLTLDASYEADIIRTFSALIRRGNVYQSKKPVQWSYGAQTALAEAEVEYKEKKSIALYVEFPLLGNGFDQPVSMVIWTTTPWTLPANLGIAVHPQLDYVLGSFEKEKKDKKGEVVGLVTKSFVIAKDLLEAFEQKTGFVLKETFQQVKGEAFLGMEAEHPFLERTSKLIAANFVTTDSGSGAVHIAPGHGADDYAVGMQNDLGVLSPVDDEGKYTEECGLPEMVGEHVFECNVPIIKLLAMKERLVGKENYLHSYPHCWRSKTPIIFRAVEQFFISLEGIREKALEEIDKVNWLPKWGRNRLFGTVEARPDWCVSRQRTWGVPVPVFFDEKGEAVIDADLADRIADLLEKEGSNLWFELSDEELAKRLDLPAGYTKCRDTLDVWIDSGSSHKAVLDRHPELSGPADLYLEATDQHRGWFQSSLMLSVGLNDHAPYKSVLTHGFVVDQDLLEQKKKGKISAEDAKISKSSTSGKPVDAKYYYEKYGADIVRLWVASVDWQTEVPFGEKLFTQIAEPYRRLRNTLRILLGNIDGFEVETQRVAKADMPILDQWVLERLYTLIENCKDAYEKYEFRKVFSAVNQFCTADLSAVYIDATKDRMYCDASDSLRRLSTQTVMHDVFCALTKLLAPILCYTTEEAWEHAGFEDSVHMQDFPELRESDAPGEVSKTTAELLSLRGTIQAAIEEKIQAKEFTKNNEADVTVTVPSDYPHRDLIANRDFSTEFFILSDLKVIEGDSLEASAQKTAYAMCPRCRRYEPLGESGLCARCEDVIS